MCISEIGMVGKLDAITKMVGLFQRCMDSPKKASGDGDDDNDENGLGMGQKKVEGRLEGVLKECSTQSVIIINGLDLTIFPVLFDQSNPPQSNPQSMRTTASTRRENATIRMNNNHSTRKPFHHTNIALLPSEINIQVGLTTLVWKPTLDLSCLSSLLRVDPSILRPTDDDDHNELDKEEEDENESNLDYGLSRASSPQFPYKRSDLTYALQSLLIMNKQRTEQKQTQAYHQQDLRKSSPIGTGNSMKSTTIFDTQSASTSTINNQSHHSSTTISVQQAMATLLSQRFEASLAEITVTMACESSSSSSSSSSLPTGMNTPYPMI